MNLSKKLAVIVFGVFACAALAGCGLSGGSSGGKVLYANHDDGDAFCAQIKEGFAAKAQTEGVNVEFVDAKGDGNLQIDQLQKAIDDGVGAIVVLAVDGGSLMPTVKKAQDAGIPVVALNRDLNADGVYGAFSDDREAGRMQGEFMAQNLPPNAQIVYLQGDGAQSGAVKRWEGFKAACLDKRPDVKLLASLDAGWSNVEALKALTLWMQIFPQIDGVVAGNDEMALGAIQALKDAGRLKGCLISGVDATPSGIKAVQAGELSQTIKQDAKGQAEGAVTLVKGFLSDKPPTGGLTIPFTSITPDNVDQAAK